MVEECLQMFLFYKMSYSQAYIWAREKNAKGKRKKSSFLVATKTIFSIFFFELQKKLLFY